MKKLWLCLKENINQKSLEQAYLQKKVIQSGRVIMVCMIWIKK